MPELPEVETVRRDLEGALVGRTITTASVLGRRTVRRQRPADLERALRGAVVASVGRHGKFLLVRLAGPRVLVIHLRMSGQLLLVDAAVAADAARPPHTHVELHLDDDRLVRFVDPRTFGEMFVTTPDAPELAHLGPDAWLELPDPKGLRAAFGGRRAALKRLLVDQRVVAGVGNIYADEILHRARLRPERAGSSLSSPAAVRLRDAIAGVLGEAIEARGSTLADQSYIDMSGKVGSYQQRHRVYGRAGSPCQTCGSTIVRLHQGAWSAFSCRRCQR